MKPIKPYLGYIPSLLVAVPCVVATVRQALFYKGCMDGFEFVLAGFFGFVAGGVLNAGFLLYVGVARRSYFNYPQHRHALIARGGAAVAGLLLVIQLAVLVYYFWVMGRTGR